MRIGEEEIKEIVITTEDGEVLATITDKETVHRHDVEVFFTLMLSKEKTCTRKYVDSKKESSRSFYV